MEPIDLMRCETGDFFRGDPDSEKWRGEAVTWFKALTRAEYDALVARLHVAEQQADALVGDRGDLLARAEKAEAQRDAYISGREMQRERANAATARADAASARLARAEALLREARPYVEEAPCPYCDPEDKECEVRKHWPVLLARIDALLDAPTPDDRRGEDGA